MKVLDLFSGLGAFSLGLQRAGFRTVAFIEIDPFCRRVLAKHWPGVPQYHDVRTLTADRLHADGIWPDVICGGFPCQDISVAGQGAGIGGERSGLWSEFARLIGEIRPRYVIVENVAALVVRGLDRVLGDLAACGYDAEWRIISAADMGAPHRRERIWIVAYPDEQRTEYSEHDSGTPRQAERHLSGGCGAHVADADWQGLEGRIGLGVREYAGERAIGQGGASANVADANDQRRLQPQGCLGDLGRWIGDGSGRQPKSEFRGVAFRNPQGLDAAGLNAWADGEWPGVPRVAKGVPDRVNRLRALGNSLIPQIPELIGRAIMGAA
jgi:DNA (cytosine-5)-methyltransferase 1